MKAQTTTTTLKFRIGLPDEQIQELAVEAEHALIGSGAHCEVRLPAAIAAREHADVVLTGDTVWVRALTKDPPIRLGSAPLVEAAWTSGLELQVGQASLWVEVAERRPPSNSHVPVLALGLLPFFGVVAGVLHVISGTSTPRAPMMAAPELFDAVSVECPAQDPESALALGQDRWRMALAKRERSPFWPRDGVEAVALFRDAQACLARAGVAEAKTVEQQGDHLRAKLEEDYRAHTVRLEHASDTNDLAGMARELPALLSLLGHRSGPYADWVVALGRFADSETQALRGRKRLPGAR